MAYLEQGMKTNRPAAVAGVIAIHAVIGYVLVTGLSTVMTILDPPPPIQGTNIIDLPPPPPPPKPDDMVKDPAPSTNEVIVAPDTKIKVDVSDIKFETTPIFDDFDTKIIVDPGPTRTPGTGADIIPKSAPAFDPVSARPKNSPGDWVTKSDYRSSWINREFTGLARFKLSVSAQGKVENCQITASTGYPALDDATCNLIQRRAKFEPARDGNGKKVSGSYSSAVRWELPE